MSKKMMKRSLALGALMAFVITGSAWAAELPEAGKQINAGTYGSADAVMERGDVVGSAIFGNYAVDITASVFTANASKNGISAYGSGVTLTANEIMLQAGTDGIFTESIVYDGATLAEGQTTDVIVKGFDFLTIDAGEYGIVNNGNGNAKGPNGSIVKGNIIITGNAESTVTISSKATDYHGAIVNNSNRNNDINGNSSDIIITAKNVEIDAVGLAIGGADGVTTINATNDLKIENNSAEYATVAAGVISDSRNYVGNGTVNLTAGNGLEISNTGGTAVLAKNNSIVNVTGNAMVKAQDGYGVQSTNSSVNFNGETYIEATGKDAQGVLASGSDTTEVTFNGKLEVAATGDTSADGLYAQNGGTIEAEDVVIKVSATNGEAVGVRNHISPNESNNSVGGTINLTGDVEITATAGDIENAYAVQTWRGNGVTTIGTEGVSKVVMSGNVLAYDGTINLNLGTADSVLTGGITNKYADNFNGGEANLAMNGATWDASNTGENIVNTMSGSGTVLVGEDDNVTVTYDETTNVSVTANEVYAAKLAEDGIVDKEEMSVLLTKMNAADNAMVGETALTGVTTLTNDGKFVSNANTSNLGIRDMAGLALVAWRAENNDMNKRLGELRNANSEHGVWVRMVRGESEYSTVKNQYNTYQLGYDEKLSTDKTWTVGMALTYTDGESSFVKGSGENNSKGVAIYGSKLNTDGSFVDLIAKYARIENEFDVFGGVGGADYDTNGYSVSAEYGKRFQQGNGLWIEPQVELTYGKVSAVDYVTKNGYKVAQDGMESLVGRLGFSLGKDVKGGNVYARASYLYDFDGEAGLTFDGKVPMEQDFGGGWWEVGVGANINLSKATYIYADVEKTFGGEVDTNWQWNLGVRYSF